jgi:hypothetical protein
MKSARRTAQTIRPRKYVLPEHPRMLTTLARRRPTGHPLDPPKAHHMRTPRIGLPCSHRLGAGRARPGDCPAVSLYDLRKGRSPW